MRRITSFYKDFRRRFYDGPDWIELPSYVRNSSYRSPTLLLVAWAYAFYTLFLTVPGRIIIAISFLIVSYSLTLLQNPIRILAFSLLAIFATDFIIGFLLKPRLRIRREIPVRVRAGCPVRVDYYVKNLRSIPTWNINLDNHTPSSSIKHSDNPATAEYIAAGAEVNLSTFLISERRGVYNLPATIADSTFPFGVFRWTSHGHDIQRLLIYPDYRSLNSVGLPVGQRYQRNAIARISKVGESMEFLGCREFRTGDNPRHIHWPSTARTGALVVREFQEEYLSRMALIVDTSARVPSALRRFFTMKEHAHTDLEAALSLSAAVSEHLLKGDFVVDIFAAGPEVYHLKTGRSLAQFENILDILACIDPCSGECFGALRPEVLNEIASIGSVILILLKWDGTRERLVSQLAESGTVVKTIIVYDKVAPQNAPHDAVIINCADILAGNVKDI
ncbi:MAG TPA: hypothetical protein DET40_25785 [Lentisphaeria bacterium]|nr:MAG: hypothetical protein A2X45_14875 [Lentisphaerae bacterium GWF2_50_93]HCE46973.1 hypothetical protein [Lentisphaeria bacterium]